MAIAFGPISDGDFTFTRPSGTINFRQKYPASDIGAHGSSIRIELVHTGSDYTIDSIYIGEAAGAGDDWDFASAPTQITFGGGSPSITVTTNTFSDTISFTLAPATDYIISVYASDGDNLPYVFFGPYDGYYEKTSGPDESAIIDVSGYTDFSGFYYYAVKTIEVPGGSFSSSSSSTSSSSVSSSSSSTDPAIAYEFSPFVDDLSGIEGDTLRMIFEESYIISHGNRIRIGLNYSNQGLAWDLDKMYIGRQADSGDEYDFAETPTQITFNEGDPYVSVTTDLWSDWVFFNLDATTNYVISIYFPATTPNPPPFAYSGGPKYYFKALVDDAATVDATGYTERVNWPIAIDFIEVQDTSSSSSSVSSSSRSSSSSSESSSSRSSSSSSRSSSSSCDYQQAPTVGVNGMVSFGVSIPRASWAAVRSAPSDSVYGIDTSLVSRTQVDITGTQFQMDRCWFRLDLTSRVTPITTGLTYLRLYISYSSTDPTATFTLRQANNAAVPPTTADYDDFYGIDLITPYELPAIANGAGFAYYSVPLNTNGKNFINANLGTVVEFFFLEYIYDALNVQPANNSTVIIQYEQTAANKPFMVFNCPSDSSSSKSSSSSSSYSSCLIDIDDDFTGTDGYTLSPNRWAVTNAGSYLRHNNLYQRPQPYGGLTSVNTKYKLCGDFDMRVDFDADVITGPVDSYGFGLQFNQGIFNWSQVFISYGVAGWQYNSVIRASGLNVDIKSGVYSGPTGRLRIVRSGNTMDLYFWNGVGWTALSSGSGADPVYTLPGHGVLRALSFAPSNPDNRVYWDDFSVISYCTECVSPSSSVPYSPGSSSSSSTSSTSSSSSSSSNSSSSSSSRSSSSSSSSSSLSSSSSSKSSSSSSTSSSSTSSSSSYTILGVDTYITQGNGVLEQHNFGAESHLLLGGIGSLASNILIKFNTPFLLSDVAQVTDIESVVINLRVVTNDLNRNTKYNLYRLEKNWSPGDSNGGVPERGDASWLWARTGIEEWGKPGAIASSDVTRISSFTVTANTTGWMTFDITDYTIQVFLGASNYGFMLRFASGDQESRLEVASFEYPVLTQRPFLERNISISSSSSSSSSSI